ncbi:MAG: DoxX family protein [Acetobacteraceae bacterium]|nr:DoxX family protein [Acetobacteraceae bacterium]
MTTLPDRLLAPLAPFAPTLLRLVMGVLFLAHGIVWKLVQVGGTNVVAWFVSQGYPAWFGWTVIAVEIAGGVALLLGWRVRLVALGLAGLMAGIVLHQFPNGWIYTSANGGWEYPAFWTAALLALAMLGPGRLALDNRA